MILVEDEKAGYKFYESVFKDHTVISSEGNTKLYASMIKVPDDNSLLVIADGAALGAYVDVIVKYAGRRHSVGLYFPESFEWLVLRSGVLQDRSINEILKEPENYIDSEKYLSWERFFTDLLREKTNDKSFMRYDKDHIPDYYTETKTADRILRVMPEEIIKILECGEKS